MITFLCSIVAFALGFICRMLNSVSVKTFSDQSAYCSNVVAEKHSLNEKLINLMRDNESLEKDRIKLIQIQENPLAYAEKMGLMSISVPKKRGRKKKV